MSTIPTLNIIKYSRLVLIQNEKKII